MTTPIHSSSSAHSPYHRPCAVAAHVARVRYVYGALEVAVALGYRSHGGIVAALQRYEAGRQRLARIARRVEQDLTND